MFINAALFSWMIIYFSITTVLLACFIVFYIVHKVTVALKLFNSTPIHEHDDYYDNTLM